MFKRLYQAVLASLIVTTLLAGSASAGLYNPPTVPEDIFSLSGTNILPNTSTWHFGSDAAPIAKIWADDLDVEGLFTITGTVASSIDFNGNDISNLDDLGFTHGSILNFGSGDFTATHATGTIAFSGTVNSAGDANNGTPDFILGGFSGAGGFGAASGQIRAYGPGGALEWYFDDTTFTVAQNLTASGVFTLTNGTGPTVDAAGEIAIDTTDDQLKYYGSAERVLSYKQSKSVALESPADADNFLLWKPVDSITITSITCIVDPEGTGESVVIDIQERDSAGDNPATVDATITCDNDGAADDGSLTNGVIDANDWISLDIGTVTGTVTQVVVTINYVINAE